LTTPTGTVLTGLSGALTNGCAAVDLSFSNFGLSASNTGENGFVTPTLANTAVYSTNSGSSGNTVGPISLTINPVTGGDWDASTGDNAGNGNMVFTVSYAVMTHNGGFWNGGSGPTYAAPNPGYDWFLDVITPTISGVANNSVSSTQTITVLTTLCLGQTSIAGCTGANQATILATIPETPGAISYTCNGNAGGVGFNFSCTNGVVNINNAFHATQVGVSSAFTMNHVAAFGTGAPLIDLNSYTLSYSQFADTPEPSTFGLLGSALAGLGFLARRRRRRA